MIDAAELAIDTVELDIGVAELEIGVAALDIGAAELDIDAPELGRIDVLLSMLRTNDVFAVLLPVIVPLLGIGVVTFGGALWPKCRKFRPTR